MSRSAWSWITPVRTPWWLWMSTCPSAVTKSSCLPSGAHSTRAREAPRSFDQMRFPSTPPTMTMPSSYAMQISCPLPLHLMSLTTLLFLLLIISSNQPPLWFIHTMIKPRWSLVVSLRYTGFHVVTITEPARDGGSDASASVLKVGRCAAGDKTVAPSLCPPLPSPPVPSARAALTSMALEGLVRGEVRRSGDAPHIALLRRRCLQLEDLHGRTQSGVSG
jgi:hypothetical protein